MLGLILLMSHTSSTKDVELLVLRADGPRESPMIVLPSQVDLWG